MSFRSEDSDEIVVMTEIRYKKRVLINWLNKTKGVLGICLYHTTDRPNIVSRLVEQSEFGYLTYVTEETDRFDELSTLTELFLADIDTDNYWWEHDPENVSEEVLAMLKAKERPKLRLAKEGDLE